MDPEETTAHADLQTGTQSPTGIFISYGRRDASDLAGRLEADLSQAGFSVWRDTREIKAGRGWQDQITDGLRDANVVVAVMSPHSVRTSVTADNPDQTDSICLAEISYALYVPPPRAVVPVMALDCEPPLAIFHLDYVDLRRWAESDAVYQAGLTRLIDSIRAVLRGEKRYRSWFNDLTPFNFSAFLNEKRRNFTGRKWFFDQIDGWRRASDCERALLITGDPGSGKSAVVAELVHRNPDGQVLAYHCCQWDRPDTLRAWRFVRSLIAMTASRVDAFAARLRKPDMRAVLEESHCRADPASAFEEGFLAPLQDVVPPNDEHRYILIDALDESLSGSPGDTTIVDILATRVDRLPDWLRIVATTRNEAGVLDRLQGVRVVHLDTSAEGNTADVVSYIDMRLATPAAQIRLAASAISAGQVVGQLAKLSAGNFLYAREALDGIGRNLIDPARLGQLPPGLSGLYENWFLHEFPSASMFKNAKRVLEIAIAGRQPLTEDLLAKASGLDPDEELPQVLIGLSSYLPVQVRDDGARRYSIFHRSLADWLTDKKRRGRTFCVDARCGHDRLAAVLWREYGTGACGMSAYGLAHLPSHLLTLERWDDVTAILLDYDYWAVRNERGQIFELADDLTNAWKAIPSAHPMRLLLQLMDETLRRDIQFIHRHRLDYPQALYQSLWNYGWWYDRGQNSSSAPALAPGELSLRIENAKASPSNPCGSGPWVRSLSPPAESLGSPQRLVLRGHKDPIVSIAFSRENGRLVSASRRGEILTWDWTKGLLLSSVDLSSSITGYDAIGAVSTACVISPDGQTAAHAFLIKKEFQRRNAETGEWEILELRDESMAGGYITIQHRGLLHLKHGRVTTLALNDGGSVLVIGYSDAILTALDLTTGKLYGEFNTAESPAAGTKVLGRPSAERQDEFAQLEAAESKGVRHLDQESVDILFERQENGRPGVVCSLALAHDGVLAACGTWADAVHVWNPEERVETHRIHGHINYVQALAFSPGATMLASGGDDRELRIWDLSRSELAMVIEHPDRITALAWSRDGSQIVSGSIDMLARVFDAQTGRELKMLSGHVASVGSVALSPNGSLAATGSEDKTVRLWDLRSSLPWQLSPGHSGVVRTIAFAPSGDWAASGAMDATIRIWDAATAEERLVIRGHTQNVSSIAVSPDGTLIASASNDSTVRVWDSQTGNQVGCLHWDSPNLGGVRFIEAGTKVAFEDNHAHIAVWDHLGETKAFKVPPFGTHFTSYAIGSGDRVAAVATNEPAEVETLEQGRRVRYRLRDLSVAGSLLSLWSLIDGREWKRLRAHSAPIDAIAFHPGGLEMVTASSDRTLVWRVDTDQPHSHLDGVGGRLVRLAYSDNGNHIFGGSEHADTIWIWPSAGGTPVETIRGFHRFDAVLAWERDPGSLQAFVSGDETVVSRGQGAPPVAFFPAPLTTLSRHPTQPVWVGAAGRHVCFIRCENT